MTQKLFEIGATGANPCKLMVARANRQTGPKNFRYLKQIVDAAASMIGNRGFSEGVTREDRAWRGRAG